MRKFLLVTITTAFLLLRFHKSDAAIIPVNNTTDPVQMVMEKISSLKVKDAEKMAGRKFTFKEKVGFVLLKKQIRNYKKNDNTPTLFQKLVLKKAEKKLTKGKKNEPGSKGQSAMVFGIAAVVTLIIGLFVPYVVIASLIASILAIVLGSVAKKENPDDSKARIGKLLGWITLGLIALFLILATIIIASWSWG